jgi:hypothetical protein
MDSNPSVRVIDQWDKPQIYVFAEQYNRQKQQDSDVYPVAYGPKTPVIDQISRYEANDPNRSKYELFFPEIGQTDGLARRARLRRVPNRINSRYTNGNQR